jgi:hypothetical protein
LWQSKDLALPVYHTENGLFVPIIVHTQLTSSSIRIGYEIYRRLHHAFLV